MKSVFISYNRADLEEAVALDTQLRAANFRTFIDKERVDDSADFEFTIYDALQSEVDCIVVVLTERAAHSRWVRFEVLIAERSGKPVFIYRHPTWAMPSFWEAWASSESHNFPQLAARIRSVGTPARAISIRWNLTTYPTPEFIGRDREAGEIVERLKREKPLVISGLGGVGKTQLALEHVFRQHADYDVIWWTRASDRATLLTDLAALGIELGMPGADPSRVEETASEVVRMLADRDRYLLVFDSAASPQTVIPFIPAGRGHKLITSRRTDWPWDNEIAVEKLDAAASIEFLERRTQLPRTPEMDRVAEYLDGLPLALAQAGAFVRQKRVSFAHYHDLLSRQTSHLMAAGALIESDAKVTSTWDVSFAEAQAWAPEALSVMAIASFLAPEGIPRELVVLDASDGNKALLAHRLPRRTL